MTTNVIFAASDWADLGLTPAAKTAVLWAPATVLVNAGTGRVESTKAVTAYLDSDGDLTLPVPDSTDGHGIWINVRIKGLEKTWFSGYPQGDIPFTTMLLNYVVDANTFDPLPPSQSVQDLLAAAHAAVTTATGAAGDAAGSADDAAVHADEAQTALADLTSQKGAPSGIAPLDSGSKLPEAQVPVRLSADALNGTYVTQVGTGVITRNPDGSIATTVEDGVIHTYTRDGNGAIVTDATDARVVTYTRDDSGITGWTTEGVA